MHTLETIKRLNEEAARNAQIARAQHDAQMRKLRRRVSDGLLPDAQEPKQEREIERRKG